MARKRKTKIDPQLRAAAHQGIVDTLGVTAAEADLILRSQIASPQQPLADCIKFGQTETDDAEQPGGVPEIALYGYIGFDPFDETATSAKDFKAQLDAWADEPEVRVRINSNGGDVFDGIAMHNLLDRAKPKIIIDIDGVAGSIAAVVAMGGDEIRMPETANMMIHDAWGILIGNQQDALDFADVLGKIDGQIATAFVNRTGKRAAAIRKLMDAETWMTAKEAVAEGFADKVLKGGKGSKAKANNDLQVKADRDAQAVAVRARLLDLDDDDLAAFKITLDKGTPPVV